MKMEGLWLKYKLLRRSYSFGQCQTYFRLVSGHRGVLDDLILHHLRKSFVLAFERPLISRYMPRQYFHPMPPSSLGQYP